MSTFENRFHGVLMPSKMSQINVSFFYHLDDVFEKYDQRAIKNIILNNR